MKKQFLFLAVVLMLLLSGCGGTNSFNPPADVVVTAKPSRIELSWKAVPAIIGYNVYRSTVTGGVATKKVIASGLTVTTFMDSSATPGVTYYYQVTAYNSTGDSTPSPEVSVMIKTTPAGVTLMGGASRGGELIQSYSVSTIAGSGKAGTTDANGAVAAFNYPIGVTTDGTNLFVADTFNNTIRKIIIATGAVTTVAGAATSGTADGTGTAARFYYPYGITTDGKNLYVSDYGNHMIRRIDIASGVVDTLAGAATSGSSNGTGAAASFKNPRGITTDGTNVFVADSGNRTIRKIVIATKVVTTLAGSAASGTVDAVGTAASFNNPEGLTTDGSDLYLTDSANHNIRRINLLTAAVTTLAGSTIAGSVDGIGTAAGFNTPGGITTDGTNLYVADSKNNTIRKVVIASGVVAKVAGSGSAGRADGAGTEATFSQTMGITTDGANLFVSDYNYSLIREIY